MTAINARGSIEWHALHTVEQCMRAVCSVAWRRAWHPYGSEGIGRGRARRCRVLEATLTQPVAASSIVDLRCAAELVCSFTLMKIGLGQPGRCSSNLPGNLIRMAVLTLCRGNAERSTALAECATRKRRRSKQLREPFPLSDSSFAVLLRATPATQVSAHHY